MRKTRVSVRAAGVLALTLGALSLGVVALTSQAAATELSAAEKGQLAQIAETYLQRRADAVTISGSQDLRAGAPLELTAQAADELGGEIAALQDQARTHAERGSEFSRAEVTVVPGKSTVRGDTVTLAVEEETRLYFPDVQEGDEITHTTYLLPHTLTFQRAEDGAWKLADDQTPDYDGGPGVPTQL